ncbi:alkaline phosphatase D family protein [Hwanghaeella sp.]|uniref:alkaline phosphatase D family protein n=1 Tax=Hwanghaeella sp. TaxID=2605943 RepID=UPI003CCC228D
MTMNRRQILRGTAAAGLVLAAPAISYASSRPVVTHGVQSGDVDTASGVIWTRTDRPAKAFVEVATTDSFKNSTRLAPLNVLPESDFAMKRLLTDLPSDQDIFYRVSFSDLTGGHARSEPVTGHFRTAPASRRNIRFVWSGDTCGQGWGIDRDRGGMMTYGTMARHNPDFFIHSGDTIYADGPIAAEKKMPNGEIWKSVVEEGVHKVAETLDEFRGRWKYNMLDEHVRGFNGQVPTFFQWDDHEVVNNWSAAKDLTNDDRYAVKDIALLAARAGRAFHEMTPIRYTPAEPGRVYRKISYGPMLDVFFIDLRSYRGPNSTSMQTEMTDESRVLGAAQLAWLKRELANSKATWKVIASDMPIGLMVWDKVGDTKRVEAVANGDHGPARGRELEFADLLRFIKAGGVKNTVWLTADVHYTAAHYYNPNKAQEQDFNPFWEFVSGPLHAGTFGPNDLDMTFGPEVKYVNAPTKDQGVNLPPSDGLQFFGLVDIDSQSEAMTVRLMDRDDTELWSTTLVPERA